jgi:hypothetical protein
MTAELRSQLDARVAHMQTILSESDPLIRPVSHEDGADDGAGERKATASRVYWNFVLMSVCFSMNHGCALAVLLLASSSLGSIEVRGCWQ